MNGWDEEPKSLVGGELDGVIQAEKWNKKTIGKRIDESRFDKLRTEERSWQLVALSRR